MNRWLLEQRTKLWWKEARECWLYLGVGWFVIVALMVGIRVPDGSIGMYLWGIEVHSGAMAILLFVSLCLGVTAYAVETEYETLTPLLAKPIPLNDIFATKLGVRLGLLFLSMVLLGAVELWTGAWPIVWRIPSPVVFERWASGLMICAMGLGLGLYFGKTLGRQTSAILASGLVFLVGYVYLTLSPLNFIFEGDGERNFYWIRGILLPGLTATVAITAAVFARIGEPGFMARRKGLLTTIAMGLYAFLFWSMTIVPPGSAWIRPELYRQYLEIRFGSPRASVDILLDRYIAGNSHLTEDSPEVQAIWVLKDVDIRNVSVDYYYYYYNLDRFEYEGRRTLGIPNPPASPREVVMYVRGETTIERMAAENRKPAWIAECLAQVRDPSGSDLQKMTAIRLAGVAGHPEHTEAIAAFLQDPSEHVQLMAALMLFGRDDPRGMPHLTEILTNGRHPDLLSYYATRSSQWRVVLDEGEEDLYRTWAVSPDYHGWRRAGRNWLRVNGTVADADLVRRSIWLGRRNWYIDVGLTPDDMDILPYLKSWDAPDYLDQLWEVAREHLEEMDTLYPRVEEIPPSVKRSRYYARRSRFRADDWNILNNWSSARSAFLNYCTQLIREGETEAVELWLDRRTLLLSGTSAYDYSYLYRSFGDDIIGLLPSFGDYGFQLLHEIVANRRETSRARFQAALILAWHGESRYHAEAFRILETFHDHPEFYTDRDLQNVALLMLAEGNPRYAGLIIDFWWDSFEQGSGGYRYWGGMTIETIDILEKVTGQNFDWDLKAWHKWWEREGMHIAATVK